MSPTTEAPAESTSSAPPRRLPPPLGWGAVALCVLTAALWGGTPVAIRFTTDQLAPVMTAAVRFALATLFMLFWCRAEGVRLTVHRSQWPPILVMGVLLFLQIATFHVGVAESNSSHGSLFINTFLFWVAGIDHFAPRGTKLSGQQIFGLLVAGISSLLVILIDSGARATPGGDQPTLCGDLVLLVSGALLGIKTVYTKVAVRTVEPGTLMFWHDIVGTLLLFGWSLALEKQVFGRFDSPVVLGLLYQGVVVAGFCFAVQAILLKKHSAAQVSVFSASTPLFGIAFGIWLRGDPASPWLMLAGVLVAWGIWLVTRPAATGAT